MPRLLRLTTVPLSLKLLLTGQPRYIREAHFDVLMASADGPERAGVIANEGCEHVIIPFTRAITPIQDVRCLWQLLLLMRRWKPDVVHTHTPKAGLLGMLAARIAGVPVRIHTIAGLPFMTTAGRRRQLLIAMERLTYWGAQHVWPNSASMLAYVREQRLCPERKLGMIAGGSTNGIDLDVFTRSAVGEERLEAVRQLLPREPDAMWVVAIGRVVYDKGIAELVAAFETLQSDYPQLRLLLAGPMERERVEEMLPAPTLLRIADNPAIHHLPWVDDVAALLCLADVLVHASHREGFPNAPLQAGAMECPIVCSDIPGNIDVVTHGETGLTYPVGDAQALSRALRQLLDNREAARIRAAALRQKVETQFDRKVIHVALLRHYNELLSGGEG